MEFRHASQKKGKIAIFDEYAQMLGYNCDYLANLLANWGNTVRFQAAIRQICCPIARKKSS